MRKFLLIIVMFVAANTAFSQISGGLKAGVNFANQNYDADGLNLSPDSRTGFHLGAYVRISPSDKFAIQPELLYSSSGIKIEEYKETWNYISVPVMFMYRPVDIFNIHAGPQLGFLMNAKGEIDGNSEDLEDTNALDYGVAFGAGVDLPMGLGFSLRYYLGLGNAYDFDGTDFEDATVTNRNLMISVTYKLFGE